MVMVATYTAPRGSKKEMRSRCRLRWGSDWYKVHPVIKKASMSWAEGTVGIVYDTAVLVTENGASYTV